MLPTTALGSIPVEVWILGLSALAIARLLFFRYKKGFSKYNGPFLASFTDLWRVFHTHSNMNKPPMIDLHEKYGDIVRVGPNILSFGNPEAIKDIYGVGKAWNKVCMRLLILPAEDPDCSLLTLSSPASTPSKQPLQRAKARIHCSQAVTFHGITLFARRSILLSMPPLLWAMNI